MLSSKPLAQISKLTLLSLLSLVALSACIAAPPVIAPAGHCSDLVPNNWHEEGVAGVELPIEDTVGQWMAFGISQTAQLDKANSQTKDSHEIVSKCEARDAAAIKAMQPKPFWEFW